MTVGGRIIENVSISNDGWQNRDNPLAPLPRVRVTHGGTEGALVDLGTFVPERPIPLRVQRAWGEVFVVKPPTQPGLYARMALSRCLREGLPMPSWVQQQIVSMIDAGETPESYAAKQ